MIINMKAEEILLKSTMNEVLEKYKESDREVLERMDQWCIARCKEKFGDKYKKTEKWLNTKKQKSG